MFNKLKAANRRLSKSRKVIILISMALVVVGILLAGWFFWLQPYLNKVNTPPLSFDEKYTQLSSSINEKLENNDYEGLMASIDVATTNTSNNSEKARLYLMKASVNFDIGKYSDSCQAAQSAEELNPTENSARYLGKCFYAMGYNDKAVEYYNKAISRIQTNSEQDSQFVSSIEQKILEIKGSSNEI